MNQTEPSFRKTRPTPLSRGLFLFTLLTVLGLSYGLNQRTEASPEVVVVEWRKQLSGGPITDTSSPTLADIDNDGMMEVIIGTSDNMNNGISVVAVLEHNGDIKWSRTVENNVGSAITVADISYPPDGLMEIIVPAGADVYEPYGVEAGKILVYSNTGSLIWEYATAGNPPPGGGIYTPSGNFAAPVVGDVDGNGDMEIVVNSWDRNIYLLDHLGNRLWYYHVADTIWSTPVLYDLNDDGDLEIITGTDIAGGGVLPDGYEPTDGGFLLVLDKNGNMLARRQMNETIYSSIAAGDADGDGDIEFFVGTGYTFYVQGNYTQPFVYGFDVDTSVTPWQIVDLPGWPRPTDRAGMSSPALADLDGNGDLEVVIGSGYQGLGPANACSGSGSDPDCHGAIYAWHHDGQVVSGFPVWPEEANGKNGYIRSSPTVGDVDNDGQQEITFAMGWTVVVLSRTGATEQQLSAVYSIFGSPAIGDLDNDGRTNLVIGGSNFNNPAFGYVHNFEFEANTYNDDLQDWPTFHHDIGHSGLYPLGPIVSVSPGELTILHDPSNGSTAYSSLQLVNDGGGIFAWNYSAPAGVTLTPGSGTVTSQQTVQVSVNANRPPGWYNLGNITINATDNGQPIVGSPVTIPVELYVGEVFKSFLPLTVR